MRIRSTAVAVLLAPTLSFAAHFELVYAGAVTTVSAGTGLPAIGSAVSGSTVFDSDSGLYTREPPLPGYPGYAAYTLNGPPYFTAISAPPRIASSERLSFEVFDNDLTLLGIAEPGDAIAVSGKSAGFSFILLLQGPTSAFTGTAIPDPGTIASFWTKATVVAGDSFPTGPRFQAEISSVSVSEVPELNSGAMLFIGLLATFLASRRRT